MNVAVRKSLNVAASLVRRYKYVMFRIGFLHNGTVREPHDFMSFLKAYNSLRKSTNCGARRWCGG